MNEQGKVDKTRRNLLVATSIAGGAAGVGAAVPFVISMWPSERATVRGQDSGSSGWRARDGSPARKAAGTS